jgi:hypothetical protein
MEGGLEKKQAAFCVLVGWLIIVCIACPPEADEEIKHTAVARHPPQAEPRQPPVVAARRLRQLIRDKIPDMKLSSKPSGRFLMFAIVCLRVKGYLPARLTG